MGIFLRERVELFTGGWVSCCWFPKRDDAENEKNNYKIDEGNRKGKYKHFVWCNFHSLVKTCKDSYKLLIMSRVLCSDEFFIKRLIRKKKEIKEERKDLIPFTSVRFTFSWILLFSFHDSWSNTVYTMLKLHTILGRYDVDEE